MNRRLLLATVAVVAMFGLAGCTTLFGPDPGDPEALSQDAEYDYGTEMNASIEVNRNNYTAVYDVAAKTTGDEGEIHLHRTDALSIERPLELRALQFRHPNGTLVRYVDGEAVRIHPDGTTEPTDSLSVDNTRDETIVDLPAEEGQLGLTTPKTGKQVAIQTPVEGSYELALPPNTDAAIPLLSQVRPAADDRAERGDRVVLQWNDIESSTLIVRWYLDRDIWLFGGLAAVLSVAGVIGVGYYFREIKRAEKRREESGLDIDIEDDDREGPPPGMR
ncbi:MAG: DUF5803 family protein [Natronomonas sp.]